MAAQAWPLTKELLGRRSLYMHEHLRRFGQYVIAIGLPPATSGTEVAWDSILTMEFAEATNFKTHSEQIRNHNKSRIIFHLFVTAGLAQTQERRRLVVDSRSSMKNAFSEQSRSTKHEVWRLL